MQSSKINETGSKQRNIKRNNRERKTNQRPMWEKMLESQKLNLKLRKKKRTKEVEVYSSQLSRSRFCHHLAGLACDLGKASF